MAETVELHIESMIPELEQMKRLGLFTPEEIQDIVNKRKQFEYKIARTMKEKQDFLRYIGYEVKLMREIKLRRDKLRLSEKKSEIEYAVAKRIVKIYQLCLSYFKSDVRIWVSYVNFCTQARFTSVVPQAFKQMLQIHSDKKHLWLFAAKWELSEVSNVEGALNYLKVGLHHHPDSQELYKEAFQLELKAGTMHYSELTQEQIKSKQDNAIKRASVHFNVAIKTIGNNVEFIISLLNVATEFRYTEELQLEIIDYLTKNCWKNELMWHTMAQRELSGNTYSRQDRHKNTTLLCIAVYKSAIKILPTALMWENFLDTLIEISRDPKRQESLEKSIIESTFQDANEFLQERHYLFLLDVLSNDPKYPEILEKSTEAIPTSVELWLNRIRYHASIDNDENKLKSVADEAKKALGNNSVQIYRSLIKYYQMKSVTNAFSQEIKNIFEEGISRPEPEISLSLRPQYIEWLCIVRSLKFARQEYEKMAFSPPFCIQLHKKMVELEMARFTPCIEIIRSIHKTIVQQFGKDSTEVWMDYIKFELDIGDASNVSAVYDQAKNKLNENLVSIFTADYAIFNAK